jgi:hypothetical protein
MIELPIIPNVEGTGLLSMKWATPNVATPLPSKLNELPRNLKEIGPLFYLFNCSLRDHWPTALITWAVKHDSLGLKNGE